MLNLIKAQNLTMPAGNPVHLTYFITYLRTDSVTVADSYSFRRDKQLQKDNLHLWQKWEIHVFFRLWETFQI